MGGEPSLDRALREAASGAGELCVSAAASILAAEDPQLRHAPAKLAEAVLRAAAANGISLTVFRRD